MEYESLLSCYLDDECETVQWLPSSGPGEHLLLIGGQLLNESSPPANLLRVLKFDELKSGVFEFDSESDYWLQCIRHDGEIWRARCMPQDPSFIGTISKEGKVFIYFRSEKMPRYVAD